MSQIGAWKPRPAALVVAARAGILAAVAGCAPRGTSVRGASQMPEYPPEVAPSPKTAPRAAPTDAPKLVATPDRHADANGNCCAGKNECKGKGMCKTDKHACKGMNACKGTGGCKPPVCP